MPVTVIVEDGTGRADANSYASVATADAYFGTRPRSAVWNGLTTDAKGMLLIHATRILDASVTWLGEKFSSAQALQFPRYPDDLDAAEVPPSIVTALCELALSLNARDLTAESSTGAFSKIEVGPIKLETTGAEARPATIPPFVRDLIAPFGIARSAANSVRLVRT